MTLGFLELCVFAVVLFTSAWVWLDAPKHDMSRFWGVGAFLLWIVFFPLYLVVRTGHKPVPAGAPTTHPPGWYPDPWGQGSTRWWDGYDWSDRIAP